MSARSFALLVLTPILAHAQQGGLQEGDTNRDGKLDATELTTYVSGKLPDFNRHTELFKELDKNSDGAIDATEFGKRMQVIQSIMQRPKPASKPKPPATEFIDMYEDRFAKRKPKLGDTIDADLSAFDGSGKPFRFASARGKYTVIVFGCLT